MCDTCTSFPLCSSPGYMWVYMAICLCGAGGLLRLKAKEAMISLVRLRKKVKTEKAL